MGRTSFSGPLKSTGGFEIGAGGSSGTNTEVISSAGAATLTGITSSGAINTTAAGTVQGRSVVTEVTSATAATTLTVTDSGEVVLITATAGVTINLPSATVTGQKGTTYTFIQGAACTAVHSIDPATGDKIMGYAHTATGQLSLGTAGAGTDNAILTLGSSATNNNIGTRISIVGDGSAGWLVTEALGLGFGYATT